MLTNSMRIKSSKSKSAVYSRYKNLIWIIIKSKLKAYMQNSKNKIKNTTLFLFIIISIEIKYSKSG